MNCDDRRQDLLLLAHGELSPLRHMQTRLHLLRCPHCRNQQHRLLGVSTALAEAIRPPDMPRRQPPTSPRTRLPLTPERLLLLLSLAVLMILLGFFVLRNLPGLSHRGDRTGSFKKQGTSDGCTPGLPNDHCR